MTTARNGDLDPARRTFRGTKQVGRDGGVGLVPCRGLNAGAGTTAQRTSTTGEGQSVRHVSVRSFDVQAPIFAVG